MTSEPSAARLPPAWPFVIVESQLLATPDFLMEHTPQHVAATRLLINETASYLQQPDRIIRKHTRLAGLGAFTIVYRVVPVPGLALGREEAMVYDDSSRVLHMIEGVVCQGVVAPTIDSAELLAPARPEILGPVRRYLDSGRCSPSASRRLGSPPPLPEAQPPVDPEPTAQPAPPPDLIWPKVLLLAGLLLGGALTLAVIALLRWLRGH